MFKFIDFYLDTLIPVWSPEAYDFSPVNGLIIVSSEALPRLTMV